jgi:myxalamid-type polyketide synthase MxaE
VMPAALFIEMVFAAGATAVGDGVCGMDQLAIHHPLAIPETGARTVHTVLQNRVADRIAFEVHGRTEAGGWLLHATGALLVGESLPGEAMETLADIRNRLREELQGSRDGTLRYDPPAAEHGVTLTGVWRGKGEFLARLRHDVTAVNDEQRERAALLDSLLRFGAAAAPDAGGSLHVVSSVHTVRHHRPLTSDLFSHVRITEEKGSGGSSFTVDARLFDPEGNLLVELERIRYTRVAPAMESKGSPRHADWMFEVQWKPSALARDSFGERVGGNDTRQGTDWLIFTDASRTGEEIAAVVRGRGGECTLIENDVPDAGRVARNWVLTARGTPVVVFLRGGHTEDEEEPDESLTRAAAACEDLGAIALSLECAASSGQPRLWVVTRGAQAVGDTPVADPIQAVLWGFARTLALECPSVWGGLIDLDPADPGRSADWVVSQITAADDEDQTAVRGGERFVCRLVRSSDRPVETPLIRPDGAYLITGGLGGLGLKVARWLAERGAGEIVLLSRTALPERASWGSLARSSSAYRQVAAIRAIERLGPTVTTLAADVADAAGMRDVIARFEGRTPVLRGVFHAAAVTGFASLPRLTPDEIRASLRPKLGGALVLHRLTEQLDLDHFVLFSSVAGLWGSRGMAHYAAGNQFLDALAHFRRARALPALAIDWGGWEGGDSNRDVDRFLVESDFRLLPADAALTAMGAAMTAGVTQQAIAWVDWRSLRASYEFHAPRPLLEEIEVESGHHDESDPATPAGTATALRHEIAALPPEEARERLTSYIRGEVADVLGLDAAHLLEPGQGFFKLGMDSLMTVDLRGRLERSLGRELPTTIAFEYPTVESLTEFLLVGMIGAPSATPSDRRVATTPETAGSTISDLDDLSESQLAALLDGTIAVLLDGGSESS